MAKGEITPDTELPEYLRDQLSLEELIIRIGRAKFPRNSNYILSAGMLEFNYSRKPYAVIEHQLHTIVDALLDKDAESIMLLFPVMKPRIEGELDIKLNRYKDIKNIYIRVANSPRVTFLKNPAMRFLYTETVLIGDKTVLRPTIGAHQELRPIEQKFHLNTAMNRYFMANIEYYDTRDAIFSEIAKIELAKRKLRTPQLAHIETINFQSEEDIKCFQAIVTNNIPDESDSDTLQCKEIKSASELTPQDLGEILIERINQWPQLQIDYNSEKIQKPKDKGLESIDAIDNTYFSSEEPADPSTTAQIVTQKTNDPTCTILIMVGNRRVALQLDSGALPNVLSRALIRTFLDEAPQWVKFIKLKKKVTLKLADNSLIQSTTHIVEIRMLIGTQQIKVPFYIIDAPGQTFIMGRISMDYLRMTLEIHNRLARCEPPFCNSFVVPFLHPDEFQSALTVFAMDCEDGDYDFDTYYDNPSETVYSLTEQEIHDERQFAKNTYLENLQKDLEEAIANGFITEWQMCLAKAELTRFWDIFDMNPGKYTGHQVHFNFIEGDEHQKKWRGEKFRPSKKLLPAIRKAITKMLMR
ncbi:unnamed protein product [Allacma fusca]|uniref:Uncharacterized protein n=1 Tax=Allacma fusca TaxID=39272 RepID=A0A8J2JQN6_9HEXA|nr:unnamed protein product [Allacma fusca]